MKSSIMWSYIDQEKEILLELLNNRQTDELAIKEAHRVKTIYFVSHGSSYNAAVCMCGFFVQKANIRAYAYTPANFCVSGNPISLEDREETLVVVISQTGTSNGAIVALEHARTLGFQTVSLTAVMNSPIAKKADYTLNLSCGEENSNAKTKGYSSTLVVLIMLAISLGKVNGTLSENSAQICLQEIADMAQMIPAVFDMVIRFCEEHEFGKSMQNLYVLGSGMNVGTAQEGQLKVMETMCIPTMFNDIGEFSHGMHRAIRRNSSILLIKGVDELSEQVQQTYEYLKKITPQVWLIGIGERETEDKNRICLPAFAETQSVLLATLVIQIMSVYAPEYLGQDPNRDSNNDFTIIVGTRR